MDRDSIVFECNAAKKEAAMLFTEFTIFAVFACPMLGLLIATYFKLDELAARPKLAVIPRRVMPCVDRNGFPLCVDPDGRVYVSARRPR